MTPQISVTFPADISAEIYKRAKGAAVASFVLELVRSALDEKTEALPLWKTPDPDEPPLSAEDIARIESNSAAAKRGEVHTLKEFLELTK